MAEHIKSPEEIIELEDTTKLEEHEAKKTGTPSSSGTDLIYGIEDVPPWYLCILLGFQVSKVSQF
jgi:hypothetical protein